MVIKIKFCCGVLWCLSILNTALSCAGIAQVPLFVSANVSPIVMLSLGRDHKLYTEAYNDASDLNADGVLDVGYQPSIDYYGYFDSHRCYSYSDSDGYFAPGAVTLTKKCAGAWSGDFLNYVTTARIDALRKVLYGGMRSTDTNAVTVVERSFIPQDAHAWGKEYRADNSPEYAIADYTPLSEPERGKGHVFANVSLSVAGPPLLRVLSNSAFRVWEWVSKEKPVAGDYCLRSQSGSEALCTLDGASLTDYSVRVRVCVAGQLETHCKPYNDGVTTVYKPIGLLHEYGENDALAFGLLTGSYQKNTSGGVLRKNIESFRNEVNANTGQFISSVNGIVSTLNRLRIESFDYASYSYASGWNLRGALSDGEAAEWGNPLAEMMYESVRYFAGKAAPSSAFAIASSGNADARLGLPLPAWKDPYAPQASGGGGFLSCAKPLQIVIGDVNPSYDTDQLPGSYFNNFTGDLAGLNVSALADTIWAGESEGSQVFIGQSGSLTDGAPTAKAVSSFKSIRGMAPEEPTKLGGYYAGSVALYGRNTDLHATSLGAQTATTLTVAMASTLPRIEIPVAQGQTITLVPFAKSVGGGINGEVINTARGSFQPTNQIVDFYVEKMANTQPNNQDSRINSGRAYGKFRINYGSVEQAGNHDMDAIVAYTFAVQEDDTVEIKLDSLYAAGNIIQHIGYVISGTTDDGIYLEVRDRDTSLFDDPDYFLDTPPGQTPDGNWQDRVSLPIITTRTFTPGSTATARFINHDPLWYAAKWGSADSNSNDVLELSEWDNLNGLHDGVPDNYFLVTNAGTLPEQLSRVFAKAMSAISSTTAVIANSSRLSAATDMYQATFDSSDWSGELIANKIDMTSGVLSERWKASLKLPEPAARVIYTYNPNAALGMPRGVPFVWNSAEPSLLTSQQQSYLNTLSLRQDALGEARLNWLRGERAQELQNGGIFRDRRSLLGDIVNSDPVFVGQQNFGYASLPSSAGGGNSYKAFVQSKALLASAVYVGANDGMLHGFDTTATGQGRELFAYIPNALLPELSKLTSPTYTHHYYVDGQLSAGDVYDGQLAGAGWRTVLAGTTGAGGRVVFALDVTNPSRFGQGNVLWEFTSAEDADLGYTFAQPSVVRMQNGQWVVIVGNGYESDGGQAVLFVFDALTGAVIKKIPVEGGSSNGLSSPLMVDSDNDRSVDAAYAGDLKGNVWKFALSGAVSEWSASLLMVACEAGGDCTSLDSPQRQAITSKPALGSVAGAGSDQNGQGVMVYFGTGKYYASEDKLIGTTPQVHSFYGVWDDTRAFSREPLWQRTNLQTQSIIYEGASASQPVRLISSNPVCYKASSVGCTTLSPLKQGWVLDLLTSGQLARGERILSAPVVRKGVVIISSFIPNADSCSAGGQSWLFEVNAFNGSELTGASQFDVNGDQVVDENDQLNWQGQSHNLSAINLQNGMTKASAIITKTDYEVKLFGGSSGTMTQLTEQQSQAAEGGIGRKSWQQLK